LDTQVAFRIASVTKMMTATALLVLADQGRCQLDDPTDRYLPRDVVDRFHDRQGRAYGAAVTLRQLLDHTSGLPDFFSQPPILDAVRHGGGRRRFTPCDLVDLAVAGEPPPSPPGTARSYTDAGFLLAGLIIEALTHRPLHEAYRELVLDPAGMADTWLESSDEAPRRRDIASHDFDGHDITDMDPTVDWAGGGLVSTAADLAAFLSRMGIEKMAATRNRLRMSATMAAIDIPPCPPWRMTSCGDRTAWPAAAGWPAWPPAGVVVISGWCWSGRAGGAAVSTVVWWWPSGASGSISGSQMCSGTDWPAQCRPHSWIQRRSCASEVWAGSNTTVAVWATGLASTRTTPGRRPSTASTTAFCDPRNRGRTSRMTVACLPSRTGTSHLSAAQATTQCMSQHGTGTGTCGGRGVAGPTQRRSGSSLPA
jgi:CubicO group peptidase (beta-lactamase class C family)